MKKIAYIMIGSLFISLGIHLFLSPHQLLDGGVIGIALIVHYLFQAKVGLTIICISLPLYFIAFFYFRSYFYNSLNGLLWSSFCIDLLSPIKGMIQTSTLQAALLGGLFIGSGIGLMLRVETSTGGTDLLAQFIEKRLKWNVGIIIFVIDTVILITGSFIFGLKTFLFSLLAVLTIGMMTFILTGFQSINIMIYSNRD